MNRVSVIIPSYNCPYVAITVDRLFERAAGDVEVVVVLDNYIPNPPIRQRPNLIIIHNKEHLGMRASINMGVRYATSNHIMKCDDHCVFGIGYDEILVRDSEPHQIAIPQRYSLDIDTWDRRKRPTAYEYAAYPYRYLDSQRYGIGLYATKWLGEKGDNPINNGVSEFYRREIEREHILIDEIMIFHGSCWFMPKVHFTAIGGLEEKLFTTLYQEPQELAFKTWLTGGRVVVNKNTWYAHMHKAKEPKDGKAIPNARGYKLDTTAMRKTERFGTWYWMNDKCPVTRIPMAKLIEYFWPIPSWPENWQEEKVKWEAKYPISFEDAGI